MKYIFMDLLILWVFRIGGIALTIVVLVSMANIWIEYECEKFGEITGIETKREPFTDCYLKVDGKWVSYLTYQLNNVGAR